MDTVVDTVAALVPSLAGVAILAVIATTLLAVFRIAEPWAPLAAIARGAVQLAVISVILTGVISSPMWIAAALVVMFTIATVVATRRIGRSRRALVMTGGAMAAGVMTSVFVVFASGALELTSRYALAIGAIIIGSTMSIATLTGRLFTSAVIDHWDEVEGWLAIGATPRQATIDLARRLVRNALIPSIDQTRTTGLVVLPGAFVGAIFGGISPLEAGRSQMVVLAAIMAAGAVTALLMSHRMGNTTGRPDPLT